jgi:hypothetical protein
VKENAIALAEAALRANMIAVPRPQNTIRRRAPVDSANLGITALAVGPDVGRCGVLRCLAI